MLYENFTMHMHAYYLKIQKEAVNITLDTKGIPNNAKHKKIFNT